MKTHEFFHKYANTPLKDRTKLIKMSKSNPLTLNDIFIRVKKLEDKIRPDIIERDKLIKLAKKYFNP